MTDTKFKRGKSGNPAGRPRGSLDKRNKYRQLLEPRANELVNKVIDQALSGDNTCLKLCMDRLVAPYRARDPEILLGSESASLSNRGQQAIMKMSKGEISPSETATALTALASLARITEVDDLEKRLSKLEALNKVN